MRYLLSIYKFYFMLFICIVTVYLSILTNFFFFAAFIDTETV